MFLCSFSLHVTLCYRKPRCVPSCFPAHATAFCSGCVQAHLRTSSFSVIKNNPGTACLPSVLIKLSGFPYASDCFAETDRICLVPVPQWLGWSSCLPALWIIPHLTLPSCFLRPSHLSSVSILPLPYVHALSNPLQPLAHGFSLSLFPSCSSEKGKDQNFEDRGHKADMEMKKSEPMVRKVTLIEVRENQQKVSGERKQEKVISSPRKDVRHPGQQWQMTESTSGVSTGRVGKAISGLQEVLVDSPDSVSQPEGKDHQNSLSLQNPGL